MENAKIKDKLWIWGHDTGSHNNQYGLTKSSRMTPAEGAFYLGVPNIIMVKYDGRPEPPYDQYAIAFRPLKQVVWSIVGAGGATVGGEVETIRNLAMRFSNITGVMMDDFFCYDQASGRIAVHTIDQLMAFRERLAIPDRKLDLWVVLYNHQLDHPVAEHLKACDVVTFWTWTSEKLDSLEKNFKKVEELALSCRKILGCYMYDYGRHKHIPVDLMKHQCELGLNWLRSGRIDGMIFLASCICDLELETVEWTRQWIQKL